METGLGSTTTTTPVRREVNHAKPALSLSAPSPVHNKTSSGGGGTGIPRILPLIGAFIIAASFVPVVLVEHTMIQEIMEMQNKRRGIGGGVPPVPLRLDQVVDAIKPVEEEKPLAPAVNLIVTKVLDAAKSNSKDNPSGNHNNLMANNSPINSTKPLAPVVVTVLTKVVVNEGKSSNQNNNSPTNITKPSAPAVNLVTTTKVVVAQGGGNSGNRNYPTRKTPDGRIIADLTLQDLRPDESTFFKSIARGVAGRPYGQTPSVRTARRAHIECDFKVDSMAYWNVDDHDHEFQPQPFAVTTTKGGRSSTEKFITFTPDRGGWNNIRMSLEVIFVIAAATKRTLVLPPKEHIYLLLADTKNMYRGFGDFFPLQAFRQRVKVISFAEYLNHSQAPAVPAQLKDKIPLVAEHCGHLWKVVDNCTYFYDYVEQTGKLVNISAVHHCLVFDEEAYRHGGRPPTDNKTRAYVAEHCGTKRKVVYWNAADYNDPTVLLFHAGERSNRLLAHFYNTVHFTSPRLSHYYKRFVRDYLHYHDAVFCAAGKVVKALQAEAALMHRTNNNNNNNNSRSLLMLPDDEGSGGFSALHVRRGDLQYAKVKISAEEWYNNTKEVWLPNELLYVATDERNKSWFDPIAKHHELRFLDDYRDVAGLQKIDPNYMGMVDTVVASRGRAFAGTYYSTFTGYINRLRGYNGLSMQNSWYSWLPKKTALHVWKVEKDEVWAYEYPDGWNGIDADEWPSRDKF